MFVRSQHHPSRVLLFDSSPDTSEVLRMVLERRGIRILEASELEDGLRIARSQQPDLIVLDTEDVPQGAAIRAAFAEESRKSRAALLILGRVDARESLPDCGRVIAKPYHFGPLIRTIEQIVEHGVQDGVAVCDTGPGSRKAV